MWYFCLSRPFLVKVNALLVFMLVTVLLHFLWYCKSVVYINIICQQEVVLKVWLRHGICRLIYLSSARKLLKLRKNTCAHCTHVRTRSHTHAHTLSNCLSCFMLSRQFHVDTSRAAGLTESHLLKRPRVKPSSPSFTEILSLKLFRQAIFLFNGHRSAWHYFGQCIISALLYCCLKKYIYAKKCFVW